MIRTRRAALLACIAAIAPLAGACARPATTLGGTRILHFTVQSKLLREPLDEIAIEPPALPGGAERPLLVLLPGYGMFPTGYLSLIDGSVTRLGGAAPDVVIVNGGQGSYYHDRATGPWGSYVIDEAIPAAARLMNANASLSIIAGISMGGFGALDLARLHPGMFCAVAAHSPALWTTGADTAPGAFDNAGDFARHDLLGLALSDPGAWKMPVWTDWGTDDFFRAADATFVQRLREAGVNVTSHVWPGGHEDAYWAAHMNDYVAWYAQRFAVCAKGESPAP